MAKLMYDPMSYGSLCEGRPETWPTWDEIIGWNLSYYLRRSWGWPNQGWG